MCLFWVSAKFANYRHHGTCPGWLSYRIDHCLPSPLHVSSQRSDMSVSFTCGELINTLSVHRSLLACAEHIVDDLSHSNPAHSATFLRWLDLRWFKPNLRRLGSSSPEINERIVLLVLLPMTVRGRQIWVMEAIHIRLRGESARIACGVYES